MKEEGRAQWPSLFLRPIHSAARDDRPRLVHFADQPATVSGRRGRNRRLRRTAGASYFIGVFAARSASICATHFWAVSGPVPSKCAFAEKLAEGKITKASRLMLVAGDQDRDDDPEPARALAARLTPLSAYELNTSLPTHCVSCSARAPNGGIHQRTVLEGCDEIFAHRNHRASRSIDPVPDVVTWILRRSKKRPPASIAVGTSINVKAVRPSRCAKSCPVTSEPVVPPSAEKTTTSPISGGWLRPGIALSITETIVG